MVELKGDLYLQAIALESGPLPLPLSLSLLSTSTTPQAPAYIITDEMQPRNNTISNNHNLSYNNYPNNYNSSSNDVVVDKIQLRRDKVKVS